MLLEHPAFFYIAMYNKNTMLFLTIARDYFRWHYTKAFGEIFHVWLNLMWYVIHFFSIPQLFRSLVSPWKRITEHRRRRWSFEDIIGVIIVNIMSRFVGFIIRSIVISIGLICLVILIFGGFITYLFWIGAPIFILSLLGLGISLLISNTII